MPRIGVRAGLLIVALVAAFGVPAFAQQHLAADTSATTEAGATFTAPADWVLTSAGALRRLDPPEGDSHIAIVDVQAADAAAALAAGWAAYRPDAHRPIRIALPQAPYQRLGGAPSLPLPETSPNSEKVVVYAQAWRAGTQWTVVIVEASQSTFEKRGAADSVSATGSLQSQGLYARTASRRRRTSSMPGAFTVSSRRSFVRDTMAKLGIPGVGLALIDGGQLVYAGGFGVRALGRPDPVDGDTLFLAASDTKALTTLLLATLADDGKLRWDQPVIEVDPTFKLGENLRRHHAGQASRSCAT